MLCGLARERHWDLFNVPGTFISVIRPRRAKGRKCIGHTLEQIYDMPRRSSRNVWKEGDGEGRKEDPSPKIYDQPPHKIVDKDESTYPPKFVDLSAMWAYQVVRCPFISHEERYARWPHVFPSKGPLRPSWVNKGLAPRIWSGSCSWVCLSSTNLSITGPLWTNL